jgi:hypothetical protein
MEAGGRSNGKNRQSTDTQGDPIQYVDWIAVRVVGTPGTTRSSEPPSPQTPERIEELVIRALRGVTWKGDHNLPEAKTERGQNLLHVCAVGNYRRLLQFLLDCGYDSQAIQDAKDDTGRTALQIADEMGREAIAKILSTNTSQNSASTRAPDDRAGSDPTQQFLKLGLPGGTARVMEIAESMGSEDITKMSAPTFSLSYAPTRAPGDPAGSGPQSQVTEYVLCIELDLLIKP